MTKSKKSWFNFKMFKDILRENGMYSQGRVYLLWSVAAYYITLGILTWAGIKNEGGEEGTSSGINMENFKIIVDALQYAMTLFGGYVFGGKFLGVVKALKGDKEKPDDGPQVLEG